MYKYTYQEWLKGEKIDTHTVYANSRTEAVSILSDRYKGVFLLVNKEYINI